MIRKHMTYENTYRDDTIENLCFLGWDLTNSIMNGVEVPVFVKVRLLQGYVLFYLCAYIKQYLFHDISAYLERKET